MKMTHVGIGVLAALGGILAMAFGLGWVTWDSVTFGQAGLCLAAAPVVVTPEAVAGVMRTFVSSHATALNGILDKLPESLRTELKTLHDSLNASLENLKPLEQVPAALEANSALNYIWDMVNRVQTYAGGLVDRLSKISSEYASKNLALTELNAAIQAGTYLTKDQVKTLIEEAKTAAKGEVLPELRATRKGALELAGLPIPDDAILGLPAAEFNPMQTAAAARLTKWKEKGFALGGKGDAWIKQTAWAGQTEFDAQFGMVEELLPRTNRSADPLLGNPGPGSGSGAGAGGAGAGVPEIALG